MEETIQSHGCSSSNCCPNHYLLKLDNINIDKNNIINNNYNITSNNNSNTLTDIHACSRCHCNYRQLLSTKQRYIINNNSTVTSNMASLMVTISLLALVSFNQCMSTVLAENSCKEPLLHTRNVNLFASSMHDSNMAANGFSSSSIRLDGDHSWIAGQSDFSQYLTIDLGNKFNISAIYTQGRKSTHTKEYVQEYRITYGNDGKDFQPYRDRNGNIKIFLGNVDNDNTKEHVFEPSIIARYVRINPIRWHDRIAMRVGLFGCAYESQTFAFNGDSFVDMDLKFRTIHSVATHVNFRFKTSKADANLIYATSDLGHLMAIQLLDNKLVLSVDLAGTGEVYNISAGSLLDDNLWHDVSVARYGNQIFISLDRVVVKQRIPTDFSKLFLNYHLYIGGIPSYLYPIHNTRMNFSGCMENLLIDGNKIINDYILDTQHLVYKTIGSIDRECLETDTAPVKFSTRESYLKIDGYQMEQLNCSFDFRTFEKNGLLLSSKFTSDGHLKLYLQKGRFVINIAGVEGQVTIEPYDRVLNDGSWHSFKIHARENLIETYLDGKQSTTRRKFLFKGGKEYFLGGGSENTMSGFIGCIRFLYIEGRYINFQTLSEDKIHKLHPSDILFEQCQMIDRCHPNPCEHDGTCEQDSQMFQCNCTETDYHGAVCHVSRYPMSCDALRIEKPQLKEISTYLDVDGSGPLGAFPVTCRFIDKITQTIIHHRSENEITVQGFDNKGSFILPIEYLASENSISNLIDRSKSCSQYLSYKCYNGSRLMISNTVSTSQYTPPYDPVSWWVGSKNQKMDYWAGALPGSQACKCGLDGSCKDPNYGCNCDTPNQDLYSELIDDGVITQKDHLPVKEIRIGDTGGTRSAKIHLAEFICEGYPQEDDAITFRKEDAIVTIPDVELAEATEVYLQFKTTIPSAILIQGDITTNLIELSLSNMDTLQLSFMSGSFEKISLQAKSLQKLNDNNWHSVSVELNQREVRLVVDGNLIANHDMKSDFNRLTQVKSRFTVGGTSERKEGYVGCMRSLEIDGKPYDIYKYRDSTYGLIRGCRGRCQSSSCFNGGTCIERYTTFDCDCQDTAFKGTLCNEEIGVNLRSENYIRYDFDATISTRAEKIVVGFTTIEQKGLILGITSYSGEYMNLLMSSSGYLKLEFDFGFERKEEIINDEHFNLGGNHEIRINRAEDGRTLSIAVDDHAPKTYTYNISDDADRSFDRVRSIYIGRNETMDPGDGFVGCVSRVEFNEKFPLKYLFQENRKTNVYAYPNNSVMEDYCGLIPTTLVTEIQEERPPGPSIESVKPPTNNFYYATLLLTIIIGVLLIIFLIVLLGLYKSNEKGNYITHEDIGAKEALDPDTAVVMGVTGASVTKKKEYFI